MDHIFYEAKDFTPEQQEYGIGKAVSDGGLGICKVCGMGEGELTTDCSGEKVSYELCEAAYRGIMDYRDDEGGWVDRKNPTNQMWDKWSQIQSGK